MKIFKTAILILSFFALLIMPFFSSARVSYGTSFRHNFNNRDSFSAQPKRYAPISRRCFVPSRGWTTCYIMPIN